MGIVFIILYWALVPDLARIEHGSRTEVEHPFYWITDIDNREFDLVKMVGNEDSTFTL